MISVQSTGSFAKLESFFGKMLQRDHLAGLEKYGEMGVKALASATPRESGLTAESWTYTISHNNGRHSIAWHNTNVHNGVPIAIILQYGHGTGTGGWVEGRDYINPAIQPVFDQIADEVWKKVTNG